MEARPVLRQLCSLANSLTRIMTRHQSTVRRTKKSLKIPPHPSFLTPNEEDHVIFNPPSSAPSVFHTPFKFLPKTDPRRQANISHLLRSAPNTTNLRLPPAAGKVAEIRPNYTVSKEQVEEMRRLRAEDPAKWSVVQLAKKFDCTNYFVIMCCKASAEHKKSEKERLEAVKARWGPIRTQAREDRQKRRKLLHRGEL